MSLPPILTERLRLPVVCSPLFIISNPDLVIAQCKAGVIGSFPALNARPAEALEDWLTRIETELAEHDRLNPDRPSAPFAVNQIVHKSNDRLDHDLEACVRHKVPVVITSLGARREVNDAVHSYGGIVLHDVIDNTFAKKAIEKAFRNQVEGKGFSLIEVVSGCPTNWGMTPQAALKWIDDAMIPYYPLGVYKDRSAKEA